MSGPSFRSFVLCSLCTAVLLGSGTPAALAQEEIFVTNAFSNAVTVYRRTATGNTAPKRNLVGAATGLNSPSGVVVDEVNNELIVANQAFSFSITVYPRLATGNTAPLRTITGAATTLNNPRGVAVDTVNNEIIVANRAGNSITVYSRTATGDAAPLRTISGAGTGLGNPWVVVDVTNNEILVANNGASLTVYARLATGNATPLRKIFGANTTFNNGPIGISLDTTNNELAVTNPFNASFQPTVLIFGRTADGNAAPPRAIAGAATALASPNAVVIDSLNNELLVPNSGINSVTVYGRTQTGNVAPSRTLSGAATMLNSPQGLATDIAKLDNDGSGEVSPLTDALLLLRYVFGFRGPSLVTGAVDFGSCSRCDATAVEAYIAGLGLTLDMDGDGFVEALTDGLLVLRYVFGFRGPTLITGAYDTIDCSRCDAPAIEAHIGSLNL
ncbi:MAG TPA: beta-propeller fold lactonase family protein [Thermoanaerobaculia bacterium]|nr:beta-propeller fold lactonase family protein [Thermoanaerobaculia bacterium]